MKCVICRRGQTVARDCTITLDRHGSTIVFRRVPADVCENCGEQYVSAEITSRLLEEASRAAQSGVEVEVRNFVAA